MKPRTALIIALSFFALLVILAAAYNTSSERSQGPQEASGVCIQGVIIFRNADSVGILWDHPPCRDEVDMTKREFYETLHRETGYLPYRCGIVFRMPGMDVPAIDTLPGDWICPPVDSQTEEGG